MELTYLAWSALLCVAMAVPYAMGMTMKVGLPRMAGNRDDVPDMPEGWIGRAKRAHRNMVENLIPFAALVLVAAATNKLGGLAGTGALLFFWGRVAYAAIYYAGIPWLRTVAWAVSVLGTILVFIRVVS